MMFKAIALTTCAVALGLAACSKPAENASAPVAAANPMTLCATASRL